VVTALAYALTGLAALQLAIPPGYAAPLYPSAGIALAATLVFGARVLPGVALGALLVNVSLIAMRGQVDWTNIGIPMLIAVGAALQAWAGASLVRRFVRQPLTLAEPRDIALFLLLGAPVACIVSAGVATLALGWSGAVPPSTLGINGLTWWAGDTLGVLIGAPITLTLVGRPRVDWAPRRMTVGMTLAVATGIIAAGIFQVARWDDERARTAFEREAESAAAALRARLQEPLLALQAMHSLFVGSQDVTREGMHRASQRWFESGALAALGWSERLPRSEAAAFEEKARADGLPDYHVFDRAEAAAPAGGVEGTDVVAIRYIEPMRGNAAALGVNAMSIPVARAAIEAATRRGLPTATAGFRLTQQSTPDEATGVVVYSALYRGDPKTEAERHASFRGVVFATLRLDELLRTVVPPIPHGLNLCIVDTDPAAERRRLAGPGGCEAAAAALLVVRPWLFAGRQWDLRVYSLHSTAARAGGANAWLFALVGLLAASMLGALLLTVTGRARRIEAAVQSRTAALQGEMRDREQAESALRASEQRFRNILDNVPIGIVYTDLQGRVIQANPRFCELTGFSEEALLSMSVGHYTHPDDVLQDIELSRRLVQGELSSYRRQKRCITGDGRTLFVQSTVSLLRDESGRPRHIVGAVEDITERLRLQQVERARDLAEASSHAKTDFLSRMSHELRTPLNAILGFAQLLELDQRHPLAPAQQPYVNQIQQAGWHLLAMINDVLDLSRIESGNVRLRCEPLDLADMVGAALPMVEAEAQRRGITITTELSGEVGAMQGDATRTRQIIINLLSNAVKYNRDGGSIHVACRPAGAQSVVLLVTDSGIGMNPAQLAELFRPFNRLGRENSSEQGTGIGLFISKSLAELMGGALEARSDPGKGTTFVLTLPIAQQAPAAPAVPEPPAAATASYHDRIVHYIEDNETNVEVMRGILAQRPQVRLDVSINGKDGLEAIRTYPPDLILLDMHLPDITGLDLLRELKSGSSCAAIPVVAVSADALPSNIQAALGLGAAHYLTKPVSVSELLHVIDNLLESPRVDLAEAAK
jgi:PAS domain S-box-containing protein